MRNEPSLFNLNPSRPYIFQTTGLSSLSRRDGVIRYSRVSLQRSCWHLLSSVLESKAAPTPSSCPSETISCRAIPIKLALMGASALGYRATKPGTKGRQQDLAFFKLGIEAVPIDRTPIACNRL